MSGGSSDLPAGDQQTSSGSKSSQSDTVRAGLGEKPGDVRPGAPQQDQETFVPGEEVQVRSLSLEANEEFAAFDEEASVLVDGKKVGVISGNDPKLTLPTQITNEPGTKTVVVRSQRSGAKDTLTLEIQPRSELSSAGKRINAEGRQNLRDKPSDLPNDPDKFSGQQGDEAAQLARQLEEVRGEQFKSVSARNRALQNPSAVIRRNSEGISPSELPEGTVVGPANQANPLESAAVVSKPTDDSAAPTLNRSGTLPEEFPGLASAPLSGGSGASTQSASLDRDVLRDPTLARAAARSRAERRINKQIRAEGLNPENFRIVKESDGFGVKRKTAQKARKGLQKLANDIDSPTDESVPIIPGFGLLDTVADTIRADRNPEAADDLTSGGLLADTGTSDGVVPTEQEIDRTQEQNDEVFLSDFETLPSRQDILFGSGSSIDTESPAGNAPAAEGPIERPVEGAAVGAASLINPSLRLENVEQAAETGQALLATPSDPERTAGETIETGAAIGRDLIISGAARTIDRPARSAGQFGFAAAGGIAASGGIPTSRQGLRAELDPRIGAFGTTLETRLARGASDRIGSIQNQLSAFRRDERGQAGLRPPEQRGDKEPTQPNVDVDALPNKISSTEPLPREADRIPEDDLRTATDLEPSLAASEPRIGFGGGVAGVAPLTDTEPQQPAATAGQDTPSAEQRQVDVVAEPSGRPVFDQQQAVDTDQLTGSDIDARPLIDQDIGSDVLSDVESDVRSDVDSNIDSDIDTDVDSDVDTDLDSDIDTDVDSDVDTDLDPDVDPDIDPLIDGGEPSEDDRRRDVGFVDDRFIRDVGSISDLLIGGGR